MSFEIAKVLDHVRSWRLGPKIAGFAAGAVGVLALGGFVAVMFSGVGFGESDRLPPQVYTSF